MEVYSLPGEFWREYPKNKNYLLSSLGRWYSKVNNKILNQKKNNTGYLRAELSIDGNRKHTFTHIAVVETFGDKNGTRIPDNMDKLLENGFSIDHVNRDKEKNCVSNLELVTHKENCRRKFV